MPQQEEKSISMLNLLRVAARGPAEKKSLLCVLARGGNSGWCLRGPRVRLLASLKAPRFTDLNNAATPKRVKELDRIFIWGGEPQAHGWLL
jgi:hypothetical protein